jgi:GT2 family glycosyltransferase
LADTKYIVFIDNDVEVAPGWLTELLQCAEDTNASIVGPLYCIGQPVHEIIHMVGCEMGIREAQGQRRLYEKQHFCNARVRDVRPQLRKERCDLVEFHCLLARLEVLKQIGPLDEALSTREHVDLCLAVHEVGGTVWFDPDAVVTYVPGSPFAWSDIPFYLLRWSDDWNQSSLRHFEQKWNLAAENWQMHNDWLRPHRQIPLRKMRARFHSFLGVRLGNRVVDALEQYLAAEALRKGRSHSPQS